MRQLPLAQRRRQPDQRPEMQQAQDDYNDTGATPYTLRSPDQIAGFFEGLKLVEPGVVPCPRWRPDDKSTRPPTSTPSGVWDASPSLIFSGYGG
ncbi:SAM-dependent methyltransferase [Micromonospora sp. SL1-18]|uniref:SAM-dependent methyltransferase n=1 Tax=Micromonospora sp. SL1-18 TaxID=3399128 RepID=UPI003A4DAE8E